MQRNVVGLVALAAVVAAGPLAAETVTGTVKYEGSVPNLKPVAMNADPVCAKKHSSPVANEMLVLGTGNTMANVIVRVANPPAGPHKAPSTPVVMDQQGCQYKPHVVTMMAGQPFKILNSDGLLHNVHALPKTNAGFNKAMPPTNKEIVQSFAKSEAPFPIKCDVHPWMQAFVQVFDHPFHAVTDKDGKFSIAGLPPGTYNLEAWHEKLPMQKATVTVGKDMKPVAFTFSTPK